MVKVTPFLWFDNQAEEAAKHYTSIFKGSKILSVTRFGEGAMGPKGSVMTVTFELEGRTIQAVNGGPHYQLTPAFSFFVSVDTQEELDALWDRLGEGGKPLRCGWLTDKFGLSWQIVPTALGRLIGDTDHPKKAAAATKAMLAMIKLDIAKLQEAYDAA